MLNTLKKEYEDERAERMREQEYVQRNLARLVRAEKEVKQAQVESFRKDTLNALEQKNANEELDAKEQQMEKGRIKHERQRYQQEDEKKEREQEGKRKKKVPNGDDFKLTEDGNLVEENTENLVNVEAHPASTEPMIVEQMSPVTKVKAADDESSRLRAVHERTYHKLSAEEITEFYNRERISEARYGSRVLDVNRDRDVLMSLFPSPVETRDRVTDQLRVKLNTSQVKTIFVRSSINSHAKFVQDKCNVDKCKFTNDIQQLPFADAVYSEKIGNVAFDRSRVQNKDQVAIVFQLESALNYKSLGGEPHLNWTASYRVDSVLNTPYERFTPHLNETGLRAKPARNYAQGKTKMAAWFVSNCGALSGRTRIVNELKKYLEVDIYGQCGKPCSKRDSKCFEQLNTDYKFYFSFENSNCKDYITEKVYWNALR